MYVDLDLIIPRARVCVGLTCFPDQRKDSMFFRTWFSRFIRHGGVGLIVGPDNVRGLFQP